MMVSHPKDTYSWSFLFAGCLSTRTGVNGTVTFVGDTVLLLLSGVVHLDASARGKQRCRSSNGFGPLAFCFFCRRWCSHRSSGICISRPCRGMAPTNGLNGAILASFLQSRGTSFVFPISRAVKSR